MFLFLHLITQLIILLQHIIHVSHRVLIMDDIFCQFVGQRFPHHCDVWHVLNFPLCCIHFAKTACSHCRQAKYVSNSPDHRSHMNQSTWLWLLVVSSFLLLYVSWWTILTQYYWLQKQKIGQQWRKGILRLIHWMHLDWVNQGEQSNILWKFVWERLFITIISHPGLILVELTIFEEQWPWD